NISNYLQRLNESTLQIYTDLYDPNSLYQLMQNGNTSYMEDREIYRILQFIANSVKETEQIHFYSHAENTSYRFAYNLLRSTPGSSYDIPIESDQDLVIESTHRSHEYGIAKPKFPFHLEQDVITLHRHIKNSPTNKILGTFSMDVKLDYLSSLTDALYVSDEEDFYIFDPSGTIILSSDHKLAEDANYPWFDELLQQSEASGSFQYSDDSFNGIHIYEKLDDDWMNWIIVKRIPYEYLYEDARKITHINSLVLFLFLLLALIATLYISFQFTQPIKNLIRYINKVEAGKLNAELEMNRTDEIGILAKRFYQLIQRLNQMITREYRLEIANKTNELKALQAQINPHFMNNALQSIGTLALSQGQKKIYALIASLGKMMRYQMNTNPTHVPLSVEIDYVKAYLNIQQQRFDTELSAHFDIDPATQLIEIPKMLLQPIVENFFKHGFQKVNANGEIIIRCKLVQADTLQIEIEDNGCGIEPQRLHQLEQLLQGQAGLQPYTEHIGLSNVKARLQLVYGEHASIHLAPREPHGLKVTIAITLIDGGLLKDENINR
ncbi:MAG TPA: histidine kinase, partial [Candidatus Paenibacillus intestinavium]|nr:histidine kinase [Candidatus Paenibacillus intestinavium]